MTETEPIGLRILGLRDAWAERFPKYVYRMVNSNILATPAHCQAAKAAANPSTGCSTMSPWNGVAHEIRSLALPCPHRCKRWR